jgi:hypothetical protein
MEKREIHFFDLDNTLWYVDSKAWVIDKRVPNKPLYKISKHDMFLIQNGLFKNDKLVIDYNNKKYYISKDLFEKIKRVKNISIENLGISFAESFDEERLNESPIKYLINNILHLQDRDDVDIAILTGRNNRKLHQKILNNLRKHLLDIDLSIFKVYFVGDRMNDRHSGLISLKKTEMLLEHMIGMKIKDQKFIPLKQDKYDIVHFYDDELENIDYANDVQLILERLLKNTDEELFKLILERINNNELILNNHLITTNSLNRFKTSVVRLKEPVKFPIKIQEKFIKSFDNFLKG